MKIRRWIKICVFFIAILLTNFYVACFGQTTGALMLLPDNFYAQMMNPSFMRDDKATEIAVPGLAGLSFKNTGNFKISDIISVTAEGNPVIDFNRFYNNNKKTLNYYLSQQIQIPVAFVSFPFKEGYLTASFIEHVRILNRGHSNIIHFLQEGNVVPENQFFESGKIYSSIWGIHELALGYAKKASENLSIGLRGKLMFGAAHMSTNNFEFGILTEDSGRRVILLSSGSGRIAHPFKQTINSSQQITNIETQNLAKEYFTNYKNPGLAFDFGATLAIDNSRLVSFALLDIGAIWFRKNSIRLILDGKYEFEGFDLGEPLYDVNGNQIISSLESVLQTKDMIRNVYRPLVDSTRFLLPLAPRSVLHYQFDLTGNTQFGITNQTVFQRHLLNTLTFTALQKPGAFSVFESLHLHQLASITFGGGVQYTGRFAQVFLSAENLLAFYHPANNRTLSLSLGMCILLNHEKPSKEPKNSKKKSFRRGRGKISPYFPFYRQIK